MKSKEMILDRLNMVKKDLKTLNPTEDVKNMMYGSIATFEWILEEE